MRQITKLIDKHYTLIQTLPPPRPSRARTTTPFASLREPVCFVLIGTVIPTPGIWLVLDLWVNLR